MMKAILQEYPCKITTHKWICVHIQKNIKVKERKNKYIQRGGERDRERNSVLVLKIYTVNIRNCQPGSSKEWMWA